MFAMEGSCCLTVTVVLPLSQETSLGLSLVGVKIELEKPSSARTGVVLHDDVTEWKPPNNVNIAEMKKKLLICSCIFRCSVPCRARGDRLAVVAVHK